MEQLSQLLSGGLVVALRDAGLDCRDPLGDDSPALDEGLVIKVLAGVERVAKIHSHVHQLDEGDGPDEALGGLRDPAGRGHALGGEGLGLEGHTVTKSQQGPEEPLLVSPLNQALTGGAKGVPSACARSRHTCTVVFRMAFSVISMWLMDFPGRMPKPWAPDSRCTSSSHGPARPNNIADQSWGCLEGRGTGTVHCYVNTRRARWTV